MTFDVLVTRRTSQQYTARALLFPDIVKTGKTEEEALEQVKTALIDLRANSRIVKLDVPALTEEADPWLLHAGMWSEDPDWDVFQSEVAAFRKAIDSH
jgi:hypothetical protein